MNNKSYISLFLIVVIASFALIVAGLHGLDKNGQILTNRLLIPAVKPLFNTEITTSNSVYIGLCILGGFLLIVGCFGIVINAEIMQERIDKKEEDEPKA